MAGYNLNTTSLFPDGTTIGAYPIRSQPSQPASPIGPPVETVVTADGSAVFSTLEVGESYLAIGQLGNGTWRRVAFSLDSPTTSDSFEWEADLARASSVLQSQIDAHTTRLSSLETRATAAESGISTLDGRATKSEADIAALVQNLGQVNAALSSHATRLTALEANSTPPTPPETIITSASQGSTTNTRPTFTYQSSPSSGATFQVSVDQGTPSWQTPSSGASGTSHQPAAGLAVGTWYFRVKATVGGNTDASPAVEQFNVIAAVVPDTIIDTYPSNPTYTQRPTFTWHSSPSAGATFEVSVDQGTPSWQTPSSGASGTTHQPAANLAQGFWTFRVRATVGGQVDPSPATYSFGVLVPAGNWKWAAGSGSVASDSSTKIATWLGYALVNPNFCVNGGSGNSTYGPAIVYADANTPLRTVTAPSPSRIVNLDNPLRIPDSARPATGSDRHFVVIDTSQTPYRIHEFWQANYDTTLGRVTSCSAGASYSLDADGNYPTNEGTGWTSNAASIPMLAGAVTPAEIQAGLIQHALHIGCPQIGSGTPVWPATTNAATGTADPTHLREAQWLRLNPSYNVAGSSLPAFEKTLAKALQDYGAFIRDNSSSLTIYGIDPRNLDLANQPGTANDWVTALAAVGKTISATTNSVLLSASFPWSQLQLLDPPAH